MEIYFINPPSANEMKQIREGRCMLHTNAWTSLWSPISLALCAAVVRKKGIEVKLIDCVAEEINFSILSQIIRNYSPDMVVINTSTPSIEDDLSTVKWIKNIDRNIKTTIIGIHGSILTEECFQMLPDLDFIVRGEPEETVCNLVLTIRDNKDISQVKGVSYRKSSKIIHNPSRDFIKNLDELPYPAWDLVNLSKYTLPFSNKRFLLIIPARGCPYGCTFCNSKSYYGTTLRMRSAENVVDELEWAKNTFGIEDFLFWTESFTLNRSFAQEMADGILKRKLKIYWICNSRVDDVDKELLKSFKEAGCWMIGYGVESGDQMILDRVKKGTHISQAIDAVSLAKKVGLEVVAYYVLGLPGETKKSIKKTVDLANKLNTDFAQFYCAVPYPGCELYEEAKEKKWINTDDWTRFEQNYSVLDLDSIAAKEVMFFKKRAYLCFYLHPKRICRILKKIRSIKLLLSLFRMVKDFLKWIYTV